MGFYKWNDPHERRDFDSTKEVTSARYKENMPLTLETDFPTSTTLAVGSSL